MDDDQKPLDARTLSNDDFEAHLRSYGITDCSWRERRIVPPPPTPPPQVTAAADRERRRREEALKARAAALEAGKIDGRAAQPQELRARLADLGLAGAVPSSMFSAQPPPAPPDTATDPETKRRREHETTEKRVRRAIAVAKTLGRRVDVRGLTHAEFAAYRRLLGLSATYIESRGAVLDDFQD